MAKKKQSKFNSDLLILAKIEVIQQSIKFSDKAKSHELLSLKMSHKVDYNLGEKMSRVRLFFDFISIESDLENVIANFNIDFHFLVENIDDCIIRTKDNMSIDPTLPSHLLAIAYSTSRGIIIERLSNTPYRDTILPIVNPYKILVDGN